MYLKLVIAEAKWGLSVFFLIMLKITNVESFELR